MLDKYTFIKTKKAMFEFQKRQVLDPSKPLLSTSSSTVLRSPLMFTTLGLGAGGVIHPSEGRPEMQAV